MMCRIYIILAMFFMATFLSSCATTCYDLADKICECEATTDLKEACKKKLDLRKSHRRLKLAENEEVCRAALNTCSCKKIETLQYADCALTPAPMSEVP